MRILEFHNGTVEDRAQPIPAANTFHWVDLTRDEVADWPLELQLHERHLHDLSNARHPPYYDGTSAYDMLVMRAIDQRSERQLPATRPIAFVLADSLLISVRDADDATLEPIQLRWLGGVRKAPGHPLSLLHGLLEQIADAYLAMREPLTSCLTEWQNRLLDPSDPFEDWQLLMRMRNSLRWLLTNLEVQREVLQEWRRLADEQFNESQRIRFNDLDEHFARVERLSGVLQHDIDALTQVHFATSGQKANRVIQFLAVISAVFLPLNLVAGIFGMNFVQMPLLGEPWGAGLALAGMGALGVALLLWFKVKRWF